MAKYNQHTLTALFFIAPQILVTIIFFIWPSCGAMVQSLYYSDAFGLQQHFAGWGNFRDLFYSSDYGMAVLVTFIIALSITFITLGLGLLFAVLVNSRHKSQQIYKSLLLWP